MKSINRVLTAVLLLTALSSVLYAHTVDISQQAEGGLSVTICNTGMYLIDEVRIYQHPDWSDLRCDSVPGWSHLFVPAFPGNTVQDMCWYYSDVEHALPKDACMAFDVQSELNENATGVRWLVELRDEKLTGSGNWYGLSGEVGGVI